MSTKKDHHETTDPSLPPVTGEKPGLPLKEAEYPGTLLKDRYLIEKRLGSGGIGVVYLARDQQLLSKPVVIKVLLDELEASENRVWFKKKFRQEIEALARIDHPGVVGVLDAGEMPDGKAYLVMQYVEGVDLRAVMKSQGMDLAQVAHIMRQIGQALSAAHEKGVYHRDVKPENIMLQTLGEGEAQVKLIDFGIATVRDSQAATSKDLTKAAGTLPYMAPEQLRGRPSAASDVYSMGVVAYEMVTGRPPFTSESPYDLLEIQKAGVRVRPIDLRPSLPLAAQAAILKALSYDPSARYLRARDFGEELARALIAPPGFDPSDALTDPGQLQIPEVGQGLEVAHVLSMQIPEFSGLPIEEQPRCLRQLQEIVRQTNEFRRAQAKGQLVCLPTGDGLALVFFRSAIAPVQCAVEISTALRSSPQIRLRMGIHTGPVYRLADINANRHVAGGGLNLAQQAMDCGDAGHILLTRIAADMLSQLGDWAAWLHDLGEQEVRSGLRLHLFNFYHEELGNPQAPAQLLRRPLPAAASHSRPGPRWDKKWAVVAALCVTAVLATIGLIIYRPGRPNAASTTSQPPTPGPEQLPERTLNYWVTLYRNRHGQLREVAKLHGETVAFEKDDRIQLTVSSPQSGSFYIVNQRPASGDASSYSVLFPLPIVNQGSPRLTENQPLVIPRFQFDSEKGLEVLWLVLADQPVPALELVKKWANAKDRGEIKEASENNRVREFLTSHSTSQVEVKNDDQQELTSAKGKGSILVIPVKFKHI